MPIYTKTGDKGATSLFGGERLSKADPRIEAYGDVDELTSVLGMVAGKMKEKKDREFIDRVQMDLYEIMGYLAGAKSSVVSFPDRVLVFENMIDSMERNLPKLTRFILPGGTELVCWTHIARVCCRRAERSITRAFQSQIETDKQISMIIQYVNRLSDVLFTFARWYNKGQEVVT